MPTKPAPPAFANFARWVAEQQGPPGAILQPPDDLVAAARQARDAAVRSAQAARERHSVSQGRRGRIEILTLLAAASNHAGAKPPELMTARGFRVTLAYYEGSASDPASICVLVQCPLDRIAQVQGLSAHLWNGSERYELGQFDSDGKAIGVLPSGVEISLTDFAQGHVKLEEPDSPTGD
jgi:hypothetical protein